MSDTKVIVDCATGEVLTVNLTTEEIADRDLAAAEATERQATEAAAAEALAALKASAREKLIAGTALTAEEAAVLVI
jgi:hypothetical protein